MCLLVRGAPWWVLLQHCITLRLLLFCHRRVWYRALSLRYAYVYSTFGHHPHPLGHLCAKFSFFRGLHCWANPWRKIAYSLTQSLIQLIWCPGNRSAYALELCFYVSIKARDRPLKHVVQLRFRAGMSEVRDEERWARPVLTAAATPRRRRRRRWRRSQLSHVLLVSVCGERQSSRRGSHTAAG